MSQQDCFCFKSNPFALPNGLELEDLGNTISITGTSANGFRIIFDKLIGTITSYQYGPSFILEKPGPLPNLWRAPTDNDEGGGDISYASSWIKMGLDKTKMENINLTYAVDQVILNFFFPSFFF